MTKRNDPDLELNRLREELDKKIVEVSGRKAVQSAYAKWEKKNKSAMLELKRIQDSCTHSTVERMGPSGETFDMADHRVTETPVKCVDCGYRFTKTS